MLVKKVLTSKLAITLLFNDISFLSINNKIVASFDVKTFLLTSQYNLQLI